MEVGWGLFGFLGFKEFESSVGHEFELCFCVANWSLDGEKNRVVCSLFCIFIIIIVINITIISIISSISFVALLNCLYLNS